MRTTARVSGALLAGVLALAGAAHPRPATAAGETWLGVYTQQITPELREGMNYNGGGALVTRVVSGSPADRAGIERGDIIIRIGSRDIDSPNELMEVVRESTAGRSVDVVVVRDDEKRSLTARLESRDLEGDRTDRDGDRDDDDELGTPAPPVPSVPEAPEAPRVRVFDHDGDTDHDHVFQVPTTPGVIGFGRGRLGVRVESLNPDLASYFGGRDTRGALVLDVTDDSPADRAGIRAGDVITRVGDTSIESADDLIQAVRSSEGTVSLSLVRHGSRQSVQATLEPRVMRFRRTPGSTNFKYDTPRSRGSDLEGSKRIVIDGDELNPRIREELDRMRQEMQRMREEMDRMREERQSREREDE